jgi:hypothetical protein
MNEVDLHNDDQSVHKYQHLRASLLYHSDDDYQKKMKTLKDGYLVLENQSDAFMLEALLFFQEHIQRALSHIFL